MSSFCSDNRSDEMCKMSAGPIEPEIVGAVIRDAKGRILDNGSEAGYKGNKRKSKISPTGNTPFGLLKVQPAVKDLKFKFP